MTILESPTKPELTECNRIISMFDRHHVPFRTWGIQSPLSFEDFLEAHQDEQIRLVEDGGKLHIEVRSVKVVIQYMDHGTLRELYENHQLWPRESGITIPRNFRGISKTLLRGENILDAARRALAVEPGYSEPGFRDPQNYALEHIVAEQGELQKSEKWPGLMAKYHWEVFYGEIPEKLFRDKGYFQVQWNIGTYYRWKAV